VRGDLHGKFSLTTVDSRTIAEVLFAK